MSIGVVAPYKKSYDISEVIMKREELIAMGVSEEDADKIMADYGSSIQREKAKTAQYKEQAEKADELQKKLDDFEAGNLTELDKANKALETANQQIAELQKNNAIRDLREKAMTDFRITAEQAKEVVNDDGNFDTAALGKIMSEKETAAAQAKEQEIANGSTNPGGGSAGGDKNKEKTADVENAENITFGIETNVEDQNHYVI
jgi:hypothetical protein